MACDGNAEVESIIVCVGGEAFWVSGAEFQSLETLERKRVQNDPPNT